MQAHVRHVEKLTNFLSPVGLSLTHYGNNSHQRKRQRFSNLTKSQPSPSQTHNPNASKSNNNASSSDNDDNNVPSTTTSSYSQPIPPPISHTPIHPSTTNTKQQWMTRSNLSLKHSRNRSVYYDLEGDNKNNSSHKAMDEILDKLLIFGYETSADIAKMQPWQLRVLKKEIPQIDYIFMTAYRMWGKSDYYDDHQNMTFRQFFDPAVWLQYNEIELIIKCFDATKRGYQCMICHTNHGLCELDQLRWHIWLDHKNSAQLNAEMQATKKYVSINNLHLRTNNNNHNHNHTNKKDISPNVQDKTKPAVISLLDDSSDDDMEIIKKNQRNRTNYNRKVPSATTQKGRQYHSRRKLMNNNNNKNNRNRRRGNKFNNNLNNINNNNNNNNNNQVNILNNKTEPVEVIQEPVIYNGCDNENNEQYDYPNEYGNDSQHPTVQIHGSQSPAFMPSANGSNTRLLGHDHNANNNNNNSSTILETMNTMKNESTYSLDTTTMDMDEHLTFNQTNNNNSLQQPVPYPNVMHIDNNADDDGFNPIGIGFNSDSFEGIDPMHIIDRHSDSFTNGLQPPLNSVFMTSMNDISVADPTFMQQFNN